MIGNSDCYRGPSDLHEDRASTLATLAILTGHTHGLSTLPDGSRPDVLQLRDIDRSLFVGDAKATETPGNVETFGRLNRYATFIDEWLREGGSAALALIVADRDAFRWLRVLRHLALTPSGGTYVRGHVNFIEVGSAVVWHSFARDESYRSQQSLSRGHFHPPSGLGRRGANMNHPIGGGTNGLRPHPSKERTVNNL
jgi:hypothetical protein